MGKYQYKTILKLLKASGLTGRGGATYPTWKKWEMVHQANGDKKYVVANGSEGEPGVYKDHYILTNHPEDLIDGIVIALQALKAYKAFVYLRSTYYKEFQGKIASMIGNYPIECFEEKGGYLAGEETTLIAAIQGNYLEPAIKPPFPPQSGLWNKPTLVNNIETLYSIAKIMQGDYHQTRFYSVTGVDGTYGVYNLPVEATAREVLKLTGYYPSVPFFAQVGGGASGQILLPEELDQPVGGSGAIIVYDKKNTDLLALMRRWANFFHHENCDKCIPCREGAFRIKELLGKSHLNRKKLDDLFFILKQTSYCALGKSIPLPFETLLAKLYKD